MEFFRADVLQPRPSIREVLRPMLPLAHRWSQGLNLPGHMGVDGRYDSARRRCLLRGTVSMHPDREQLAPRAEAGSQHQMHRQQLPHHPIVHHDPYGRPHSGRPLLDFSTPSDATPNEDRSARNLCHRRLVSQTSFPCHGATESH